MHKLFQLVPDIQKVEFNRYLESSTEKKVQLDKYCWNYRIFDEYGSWIVFLPSYRTKVSLYYQYVFRLARRFKVLALDFPETDNINDLKEGIKSIIDKEGITDATIIGLHDFGFMAPILAKEFPDVFKRMIISSIIFNSSHMSLSLKDSIIKRYEKNIQRLKLIMNGNLYKKINKQWSKTAEKIIGEELYWKIYFKSAVMDFNKNTELNFYSIILDFFSNYQLDEDDYKDIPSLYIDTAEDENSEEKDISLVIRDFFKNLKVISEKSNFNSVLLAKKTSFINHMEDFIKNNSLEV